MKLLERFLLLLAVLVAVAPASSAAPRAPRAGDIVVEAATTSLDGRAIRYEIGTLYVPENRDKPDSRLIGVGFARVKATHRSAAPPVFILPGGPGRSYLNAFTDRDDAARTQLRDLLIYADAADIVVVDQRGWSRRGDTLEMPLPKLPLDRPRSREAETAGLIALANASVSANPGKNLSGYTIVQCAEDVYALRNALGYKMISLSGQSFGSQWSLAVIRLHPDIVSRAVLSGVEPLDAAFDMPSGPSPLSSVSRSRPIGIRRLRPICRAAD